MANNESTQTASKESKSRFSRLKQISSIVLAVALLAIVVASISIPDFIDALRTMDVGYVIIAYALNLVMIALMAYRWYVLYIVLNDQRPKYAQMLSVSFMGIFFNNFLPSTIGGDAYRTLHMARQRSEEGFSGALAVVFVDRVVGLLGLALIGLGSLALGITAIQLPTSVIVWIAILFTALSMLLILSMSARFHSLVLRIMEKILGKRGQGLRNRFARLFAQLAIFSGHRSLLAQGLALSVILRLIWIFGCYLLGLALHLEVPIIAYLVAIPLIELLRMIPLTLQGIGVREGLFVLFFDYYDVSSTNATMLAFLVYLLLNLNGVIGGVLFLIHQHTRNKRQITDALTTSPVNKS